MLPFVLVIKIRLVNHSSSHRIDENKGSGCGNKVKPSFFTTVWETGHASVVNNVMVTDRKTAPFVFAVPSHKR